MTYTLDICLTKLTKGNSGNTVYGDLYNLLHNVQYTACWEWYWRKLSISIGI